MAIYGIRVTILINILIDILSNKYGANGNVAQSNLYHQDNSGYLLTFTEAWSIYSKSFYTSSY